MTILIPTQSYTQHFTASCVSDLTEILQGILQISTVSPIASLNFYPFVRLTQHSASEYERLNGRKIIMEFTNKPITALTVEEFLLDNEQAKQALFPHLNWSKSLLLTVEVAFDCISIDITMYDMDKDIL